MDRSMITDGFGYVFGAAVLAAGILNSFWGNDPQFGIFLILLAFVFFPPVTEFFIKISGFKIPVVLKIVLGIFIVWAVLGVGELFAKLELMQMDLR